MSKQHLNTNYTKNKVMTKHQDHTLNSKSSSTINLLIILSVILLLGIGISQFQIYKLNKNLADTQQELNQKLNDVNSGINSLKQTDEILTKAIDDQTKHFNEKLGESQSEIISVRQQLQDAEKKNQELINELGEQIESVQIQSQDFTAIVDDVIDSVVIVLTDKAQGSGVFVSTNRIITNYHVIQGASSVQAITYGNQVLSATIVGVSSQDDLALLEVQGSFESLGFANSADVRTGEKVIALGSPQGLRFSVTEGIVSNPSQPISGSNYVQHSVAINPGNSGGPLVNLKKEIVGVNTFKLSGNEGLGFAIPADRVQEFINALI